LAECLANDADFARYYLEENNAHKTLRDFSEPSLQAFRRCRFCSEFRIATRAAGERGG